MRTMAVYRILNLVTGKQYVGSSVHVERRWKLHQNQLKAKKHHAPYLQRSWDTHGPSAFLFEILEVIQDEALLLPREQHYLDLLQCCDPTHGYNTTPLAGSNRGCKQSPETRAKISAAMKGRVFTAEHKARIAAANQGRTHSPATIAKLCQIAQERLPQTGTPCAPETRAKISAALTGEKHPQFGKPLSEATRRKIGEQSKGRQSFLGRSHSEETKEKMRMARLGKKLSEEAKAKVGAANRGREHTEADKAKMREGHQRRKDQAQREMISSALEKSAPSAEAAATAAPPTRNSQDSPGTKR